MPIVHEPWIIRERPEALPGTTLAWAERHLVLTAEEPLQTANSSLFAGGFQRCSHIINRHVDSTYNPDDPEIEMRDYIRALSLPPDLTAGLMTAVDLRDAVGICAEHRDFRLFVLATVGVRNASRAGVRYEPLFPAYHPGTINTIVLLDAAVTPGAMLNAFITITEAKTAALLQEKVMDADGRQATGTTTDAVLVAATQDASWGVTHRYMGVSTEIGSALGQAVYEAVRFGLQLYRERRAARQGTRG
jgi:adenosylcobinamide amidohydrolase